MNKVRVNVYFSEDIKNRAEKMAERLGVSFSGLCNLAMYEYLKQSTVADMFNNIGELSETTNLNELKNLLFGGSKDE